MKYREDNFVSKNEELLYEQVADEISNGNIRKGLWLKALSENGGDENKAKASYAKFRVTQLLNELKETIEADAEKARNALANNILELKEELKEKNCTLDELNSGEYILYTKDGGCIRFNDFESLKIFWHENYK